MINPDALDLLRKSKLYSIKIVLIKLKCQLYFGSESISLMTISIAFKKSGINRLMPFKLISKSRVELRSMLAKTCHRAEC